MDFSTHFFISKVFRKELAGKGPFHSKKQAEPKRAKKLKKNYRF
jgi:hypothetical protein